MISNSAQQKGWTIRALCYHAISHLQSFLLILNQYVCNNSALGLVCIPQEDIYSYWCAD